MGLAVLANPLRPDTAGVIECLQKAQIRCAMVTGDHLRTAISVAHQCSILPGGRPVLLMDAAGAGEGAEAAGGAGAQHRLGGEAWPGGGVCLVEFAMWTGFPTLKTENRPIQSPTDPITPPQPPPPRAPPARATSWPPAWPAPTSPPPPPPTRSPTSRPPRPQPPHHPPAASA
jgi:hypothetical protein